MITGTGRSTDSAGTSIFTLAKGSTNLVSGDGMARINQPADNELIAPVAITLLDSPNTTSATTYRVQSKTSNGNNSAIFGEGDTRQTMILMEIGA